MAQVDVMDASNSRRLMELSEFCKRQPANIPIEPRLPPEGVPSNFDQGNLTEVFAHLSKYEAVPQECIRALKALASLAYSDADAAVALLPQLLRTVDIHPEDKRIQALVARIFGHFAYDAEVARRSLCELDVIDALLQIMATCTSKDASARASEAMARIIVADTTRAELEEAPLAESKAKVVTLIFFYMTVCRKLLNDREGSFCSVAKDFTVQLLSNEILEASAIIDSLLSVANIGGNRVIGWLFIAEDLIDDPECGARLLTALMHAGFVEKVKGLMSDYVTSVEVQSASVGALMCAARAGTDGLKLVADVGACQLVEAAMDNHLSHAFLQEQCVQFWALCVAWTKDLQLKAGFSPGRAIDLIKTAMASHIDCAQLQLVSLETLAYYLERLHCHRLVKVGGGDGLVKAVMTRHASESKIQTWAKCVLDAIGSNRHWLEIQLAEVGKRKEGEPEKNEEGNEQNAEDNEKDNQEEIPA